MKAVPAKRRWNFMAICWSFVFPCVIFVAVLAATSFPLNYSTAYPGVVDARTLCWVVDGVTFLLVLYIGVLAIMQWLRRRTGRMESTWYSFLFVTGLLAWVVGVSIGDFNSSANLRPYYDLVTLNNYTQVDVTARTSEELRDAGRIQFARGTHLDLSKSMGFRHGQTYCVTPIAPEAGTNYSLPAFYYFWAVGINCCSEHQADFHCGDINNTRIMSGLRVLDQTAWPMYQYAVQQAEATYGIRADKPMFLTWMQDPDAVLTSYREDAMQLFLVSIYWYVIFQFLLVAGFVLFFFVTGMHSSSR
jgi:hypothetical protein